MSSARLTKTTLLISDPVHFDINIDGGADENECGAREDYPVDHAEYLPVNFP